MDNIGALMSAFSALKTTLGAGPYKTLIKKIANEKDITEKRYLFAKAAKAAASYYKLGIKAGHSLYEKYGIIDIKFMPNSIKCASCGEPPHGLNDVMTNEKGNATKVIIHNPSTYNNKTKKITPAKNDTIPVTN